MELAGTASEAAPREAARRPSVDVVVPFHGGDGDLRALVERLAGLHLRAGDTLTVVDNRASAALGERALGESRRVLAAPDMQTSYFARNAGAAGGRGEWLVFIDADTEPPPDLLDRYFEAAPGERTAVLAGGVRDEARDPGRRAPIAVRYAELCSLMSQGNTLRGEHGYAQTANCAVRRSAFEAVGGFEAGVRSGGDADLCLRLRAAGYDIEPRDGAAVVHRSRRTIRGFVRQRGRYGSGSAWLETRYPGFSPPGTLRGALVWSVKCGLTALRALARRDRDGAIVAFFDQLGVWAFELGRRRSNLVGQRT